VTAIKPPVEVPADTRGTTALICVPGGSTRSTVKEGDAVPLKVTAVAPVKWLPVMIATLPIGPVAGANEVIFGGTVTVKLLLLTPVPTGVAGVVTLIGPVVVPSATMA